MLSGSANTTCLAASATQRYSPLAKSARAFFRTSAEPPMYSTYFFAAGCGGNLSRLAGLPSYQPM
ncbi:hypothetical protein D3C81_2308510 [compost metagenome]